ncbi:MAG: glycosyltransferase [Verrucomicrobia bacterium]|nr:glycosyltransferase [Verrucomicrobiota bacterium]
METPSTLNREESLSFVVPLRDEAPTLVELFEKIEQHASKVTSRWEVIFVDDGSTDGSWEIISRLALDNPGQVKAIRFRRNLGKAEALAAGWQNAQGEFVFTMDADLQDDPAEIPRFLEKMAEGWDIVCGWKRRRNDPWHKVLPSRVFNLMLSKINRVRLHDQNCGFKCYRREVVRSIALYGDLHRMVPSLAAIHGYRTTEIAVQHHPRTHGRSKYGFTRFLRGFLDIWTVNFLQNFRHRPFHLLGSVALGMILSGLLVALLLLVLPLPLKLTGVLDPAPPILMVGALLTALLGLVCEWNIHERTEQSKLKPIVASIGLPPEPRLRLSASEGHRRSANSTGGPLVLLIERDVTSRETHAAHLSEAGWSVIAASSCHEAQLRLSGPIEVVLLDSSSGTGAEMMELVRLARHTSPNPRVIFLLSGATADPADMTRVGAFAALLKPVEPTIVVGLAQNALSRGRQALLVP